MRTIHPGADVVPLGRFDVQDIDSMRLLLRGSSIIDWYKLHFQTPEETDAYIRVNEFDVSRAEDRDRINEIRQHAIVYLTEHLGYRLPNDMLAIEDLGTLLEYASGKGRRSHRFFACLILKAMHIIHYVEARELRAALPISNAEIGVLLHAKVERFVRGLFERNFPIVEFAGNTKSYHSIISKLLAKKDTQAAQVFDRLRFRFTVKRLEDIPALLLALTRELIPFNYVVPNQADNTLVELDRLLLRAGNIYVNRGSQYGDKMGLNEAPAENSQEPTKNEFSGPNYRVVNFVGEVPLRLDSVLNLSKKTEALGLIVFSAVEFQIVDETTAKSNESGPNRHDLYKERQLRRVQERLERGKRMKREPTLGRASNDE